MAKYKLLAYNGKTVAILQKEDLPPNTSKSFPLDEANSDYQAQLEWAKTNIADPAD